MQIYDDGFLNLNLKFVFVQYTTVKRYAPGHKSGSAVIYTVVLQSPHWPSTVIVVALSLLLSLLNSINDFLA